MGRVAFIWSLTGFTHNTISMEIWSTWHCWQSNNSWNEPSAKDWSHFSQRNRHSPWTNQSRHACQIWVIRSKPTWTHWLKSTTSQTDVWQSQSANDELDSTEHSQSSSKECQSTIVNPHCLCKQPFNHFRTFQPKCFCSIKTKHPHVPICFFKPNPVATSDTCLSKPNLFNKTSSVERWWNSFHQRFCLLQWWSSCKSSQCFNCHDFSSVHCWPSKPWSHLWWLWWWSPMTSQAWRTLSTWNWHKWQNPINTIDSCSTQWSWHSQESLVLEDWSFCKNDWKFATCKWWTQWCSYLPWTHWCSLLGLSCWRNIYLAFFWRAWTKRNDLSNHSSWNYQLLLTSNCFFVGHCWHLRDWLAEIKQMHFTSPFPTSSNVQRHLHFTRRSRDVVSHHVFNDSQDGSQSWWHRS